MKKEIPAGLIAIVAIAAIAIFAVTPSMSTSFELDGKLTSDELELLFQGSGNDEYQEYKYVSEKIEKSRISASAGGTEVYEAGFGGDFLNWLKDLFSGWLNDAIVDVNEAFPIDDVNPEDTDPDVVIEDIGDLVEDEKVGEPGPTPVAGKVIGEYAGPMELIIDGKLNEDEKSMLDAMGVGEIVFGRGRSTYDVNGVTVPGVKSTRWAFIKGIGLYVHEENYPKMVEYEPELLGHITFQDSKTMFPRIACNFPRKTGYLTENDEDRFTGMHSHKFSVVGAQSGNEIEYVVEGLSREFIEKNIGDYIKITTLGGEVVLNTSDIKELEIEISY